MLSELGNLPLQLTCNSEAILQGNKVHILYHILENIAIKSSSVHGITQQKCIDYFYHEYN